MDIVTTSNFHATLLPGELIVVFIPAEHLRACCWPLLNLLLYGGCGFEDSVCGQGHEVHICRSVQAELFSIAVDDDGATLYMDPSGMDMFKQAGLADLVTTAPHTWRAIQIHLGPMVEQFPGVISFLSKLLAEDDISILNMSTYDTDIIYVQEPDLDAAVSCLQSKLSRGVHGLKEAKDAERERSSMEDAEEASADEGQDASCPSSIASSDQFLKVYPEELVLLRLRKDSIKESAFGLTQLMLLSSDQAKRDSVSFWCYCETSEEISLIMNASYVQSFTDASVVVAPDRWRAIKLCGRTYGFEETGVVAAMSGFTTDVQVLNVSSFGSNMALVLDETLDESLPRLCSSLDISRVDRIES